MKIKNKIEDCYLTVMVKCSLKEKIAIDELETFKNGVLKGFMKLKSFKKRKALFTGIKAIPLNDRLTKPINKHDFFFILEQFLIIMNDLEASNLSVNSVRFSLQNIYITETTKEIQLIYIPLENQQIQSVPMDFIEALVYSSIPAQENDTEYITRFAYFLKTLRSFKVSSIESYIAKEAPQVLALLGRNVEEEPDNKLQVKRETTISTTKRTESSESLKSRIVGRELIDDDQTLFDDKRRGIRVDDDSTILSYVDDDCTLLGEDDDQTLLNTESGQDDETEMLGYNPSATLKVPYLIRTSTNETITINKPSFRIGIKVGSVDFVVTSNNAVSRSHADIICKSNRYFIYDLESKNKTYVNDRVIPSKTEVEIFDRDNIKLANEEFVFHV